MNPLAKFLEMLVQYGDHTLGIEVGDALRPHAVDETTRLRITRRNNVVVEVDGHVVATALSTYGIRGRRARREAAEDYMAAANRRPPTADDLLAAATGGTPLPRIDGLEN